ncbi:hypothetical protein [Inquilinus limosus]|uniref:Uncharacterized protein n=1 Tax=Inquilinus limosus MP06 TaxID=1398085 RepID=A0A0A0D204_9PROT|nr:hypothetical protein [Inquilinus limosus]KGM32094.1 hypothetical protein P409_23365 [Inquilinus limosus MP06]
MSAAEPRQAEPAPDDKVDEAIEESFPASDPPAYPAGVTSGAPSHEAAAPEPKRNAPVVAVIAVAVVIVLLWALFG